MEVREILRRAMEEVDAAEIPSDLREIAFSKAVELIGPGSNSNGSRMENTSPTLNRDVTDTDVSFSLLQRIANHLKVDATVVSEVYSENDSELELVVSPGKLDHKVMAAMREIAILVAVARQASGQDQQWTAVSEIRKWCELYRKYDSSNFAKTILAMEDVFLVRGQSVKREVRVTRAGWESAKELVIRLAGGES